MSGKIIAVHCFFLYVKVGMLVQNTAKIFKRRGKSEWILKIEVLNIPEG